MPGPVVKLEEDTVPCFSEHSGTALSDLTKRLAKEDFQNCLGKGQNNGVRAPKALEVF